MCLAKTVRGRHNFSEQRILADRPYPTLHLLESLQAIKWNKLSLKKKLYKAAYNQQKLFIYRRKTLSLLKELSHRVCIIGGEARNTGWLDSTVGNWEARRNASMIWGRGCRKKGNREKGGGQKSSSHIINRPWWLLRCEGEKSLIRVQSRSDWETSDVISNCKVRSGKTAQWGR